MEKAIQTFWGLLRIERHIVYSKGVINETWNVPCAPKGAGQGRVNKYPQVLCSSSLHSAERFSAGIVLSLKQSGKYQRISSR